MTYYGGRELASAFRTVRGNTITIAKEIPEDKYDFRAAPETRTVAQMLAHVALGPSFALHVHGSRMADLKQVNFVELVQKIGAEEAKPRTKAQTIALLESEGEKFASFLEGLTDTFLAEPLAMPPGAEPAAKSRFELLLAPKEHEMHHRGQLMVIERMLGLVPHLTRQRQARLAGIAQAQTAGR